MKQITHHDYAHSDRIKEELQNECWNPEGGLFFLSKNIIGFDRLQERVHRPAAKWYQSALATPNGVLAVRDSRASGKTTLFTKSGCLWMWSSPPISGTPLQGVNTRIGIVAPKKQIASQQFIKNIMDLYEGCRPYQELFEWVRPRPDFWSVNNGLMFYRTSKSGDPSLAPVGMESVSTSYHFDVIIIDDPIHEQNWMSETEVKRCVTWMYLSHNLTRSEAGIRVFVGNFWRVGDVQDQLRPENEYFRNVKIWERGMTGCADCVNGRGSYDSHQHTPPLEAFTLLRPDGSAPTMDDVEEARRSMPTYIYMAQCENNPVDAGSLTFKKEWVKKWWWHYYPDGEAAICFNQRVDVATAGIARGDERYINRNHSGGTQELIPLWNTDMYILIDPAPSVEESLAHSQFSFAVLAREKRSPRTFLIQEYAANDHSPANLNAVLDAFITWQKYVRKIGYESVGYQATIGDTLYEMAKSRGIHTLRKDDIIPVPRLRSEGQQDDRIKYALIPIFESGNFFYRDDHRIFILQYDNMGKKGAKHDLLDAISNGPRVWQAARTHGVDARAVAEHSRERLRRTGPTGY